MSTAMPANEWLTVLRKEYLQDFVKSGGAAVKFVIPLEWDEHQRIIEVLRQSSQEEGYVFVHLDAASTKLHMIDKMFHAVAMQVAWDDLAYTCLRSILIESSFVVPEDRNDFGLAQLAKLNGLDLGEMRREAKSLLGKRILRDFSMTHEFRIAMLRMCAGALEPQGIEQGVLQAVKQWLTGELRLISALRSATIFQRIGRQNGRRMLSSLTHWLHLSGKAGLVLALDISRFLEPKRRDDGSVFYSGAAVLDGHELLRQFVDSTDELEFCLILAMAPCSFLVPDERRGLWAYPALRLRIWDEVRDRSRANPLSSLVRLAESGYRSSHEMQEVSDESRAEGRQLASY